MSLNWRQNPWTLILETLISKSKKQRYWFCLLKKTTRVFKWRTKIMQKVQHHDVHYEIKTYKIALFSCSITTTSWLALVVEENDKYLEIGEVCEFGEACGFWRNLEKHAFLEKFAKGIYMFLLQTCYGKLKPIMRLLRLLFKNSRLEDLEFEVG